MWLSPLGCSVAHSDAVHAHSGPTVPDERVAAFHLSSCIHSYSLNLFGISVFGGQAPVQHTVPLGVQMQCVLFSIPLPRSKDGFALARTTSLRRFVGIDGSFVLIDSLAQRNPLDLF